MKNIVTGYVDRMKKNKQIKHKSHCVVVLLVIVIAILTAWTMHIDGLSMIRQSYCGMEEHTHADTCWEDQLICNLNETQGHVHSVDQGCYEEQKLLKCAMEHEHTEKCYCTEQILICEEQEQEEHKHNENCWNRVQTCGLIEHVHDVQCYADVNADIETASSWEKTLPNSRSGIWANDFIAVAESQIGYAESDRNYTVDLDGNQKGYTRYGQWYGSCYDDWDMMFVSWCLHYAEIDEASVPRGKDCQAFITQMKAKNLYKESPEYVPLLGDIVFFDLNKNGAADHTGIVTSVNENVIKTIEGDSNDCVQRKEHDLVDQTILGYGSLPKNPKSLEQQVIPQDTTSEKIIVEESKSSVTELDEKGFPFYWESSEYDYVYQGNYKNSNFKITPSGENKPMVIGTKVLVPGKISKPWSPNGIPWVPGESNYQIVYGADIIQNLPVATYYKMENLSDTDYLTQTQKESLNRIIKHSYPFISDKQMLEEMQAVGVDTSDILISEMMSGTQQAIWKITNGIDFTDCGEAASNGESSTTQIYPLSSTEIGKNNGMQSQKAAQKVKNYLLELSDKEKNSVLEIEEILISDITEVRDGALVVSAQINLNRPVSENDKDLNLTIFWGNQEQKLTIQTGDQKINVQLDEVFLEDQVEAKLIGRTEGFWELYYYIGSNVDHRETGTVQNLIGGYPHGRKIVSQKQVSVIHDVRTDEFPKLELTQMIGESGVDLNRLIWQKPSISGKIFGSATEYCLFTLNDFNVKQGSEIVGSAAVGGVFNNRGKKPLVQIGRENGFGNGIPHTSTKADLNFIVGNHVDGYFKGDIWGWLASRNFSNLSFDGTDRGPMTRTAFFENDKAETYFEWYIYGNYIGPNGAKVSSMLDSYFVNAKKDLEKASEIYRKPIGGTTGTVDLDLDKNLILHGTDPDLNFFGVTVEQFNAAREILINVPKDAYTQINIIGNGKLEFRAQNVRSSMMVQENAKDPWGNPIKDVIINSYDSNYHKYGDSMEACRHLFWNMPDVTEIVTKTAFAGSILAPQAHLEIEGVDISGSIIVKSATLNNISGEIHHYPFDHENWPNVVPKSSVKVTKTWVGAPAEQVEVELVADGVPTGMKVILNEQNKWTDTFTDLPVSTNGKQINYTVVEKDIPGYSVNISGDAKNGFVITNTKIECKLKLQKLSVDSEKPLQGAKFKLYCASEEGSELLEQLPGIKLIEVPGEFMTDFDGSITINELVPGTYYLLETRAPDGYELLEQPVPITLTQDSVVVVEDNALIQGTSGSVELPTLTIKNKPGYRLPETGGLGTLYYVLVGIIIMVVSLMYYVRSCTSWKNR